MVEIFRNWVESMLCIGVLTLIIQLLVPKTNLKKHIYSLIGVVTVLTLVAPIIANLKDQKIEENVSQVIANIESKDDFENSIIDEENTKEKTEKMVIESFAMKMKQDIKQKLETKGVDTSSIDIFMNDQYNIDKLKICIKKIDQNIASINSVTQVIKYINEEYDLDVSKIEVVEEG